MVDGHSVLLVPVPELESFVRARHAHYDLDYVSCDPTFTHAHVTVLGPFVTHPSDADLAAVAAIAGTTAPFDHALDGLEAFADGLLHLVPDPAEPFRALTARVHEAFPDHPPYAGRFEHVVPHLTLDVISPAVTTGSTRALLGDLLPARCRAERLDLAWYEPQSCRVLATWPLDGVAADTG